MKFFRIEMLFLIWAVPLLFLIIVCGMKRRRKILLGYSSARGLKAIAPKTDTKRRWLKAGLVLGALIFIALALAGPQYGYKWREIERKGVEIIVALDCSRSMLATDIKPTRLHRAKREIFDLLHLLKGDRVGLVAFAGTAFLQCPLTLDYEAFNLFLNALTPDFLPVGGTDVAGAVTTALSGFNSKDNSEKAVILITDGESTGGDPVQAAEKAKAAGVKLFCIGVGKGDGVPVPDSQGGFKKDRAGKIVITRLDEDTLKKIAVLTGGTYVRSIAGDMDLDVIYNREIRGKMDVTTLSSGRKQIWEDRYQWFLALALAVLVAELFLPSARKTALVSALALALILNHSPVFAAGWYQSMQKGLEAYEKQDYEGALKSFIDAQLDDPDRPKIHYNIGNTYYRLGDYQSAYENYEQVLKSEKSALKQKALYNRGNSNYRMGKLEDAVADYEAALKLDADDHEATQNLEFVKKMMEMKKQQQQQKRSEGPQRPGDQKESTSERQAQEGSQSKDNLGSKIAEKNNGEPPPEYGESMEAKPEDASKGQAAASQQEKTRPDPKIASKKDDQAPDPDQRKQAERMLNRLQDMPGKAMMPDYRERKVEKDW